MAVDVRRGSVGGSRAASVDVAALLRRLDWVLLLGVGALVAYGLWAVSGITRFDIPGDPDFYVVRQGIAVGLGCVAALVAMVTPTELYRRHWRAIYAGTIALMVVVFVFAEAIRGSKRWIELGPLQFQPSEFGKA
ncbi:MAG: FtsW/RodA/SpoVE family cell cycle protein, partial [Gaiella sp.]